MTDEQKAALEWFDRHSNLLRFAEEQRHCATLKAMLAEPRLPEMQHLQATGDAISALGILTMHDTDMATEAIRLYHNHLYRRLTMRKTKTVWEINGCGRSAAPYECDCRAHAPHEIAPCIERLHRVGFTRVTIITREVPA